MRKVDAIKVQLTVIPLTLLLLSQRVRADLKEERSVSTSVSGMVELLSKERALAEVLAGYANELQKKVYTIKSAVVAMLQQNNAALKDSERYLANPLNAFSLIRRMHSDWANWEEFMKKPVGLGHIQALGTLRQDLPTDTDLTEAAEAIYRLQWTYDLKVADIAAGILMGKRYDAKLSSIDCYAIGCELLKLRKSYQAGYWLYTALNLHNDTELYKVLNFQKKNILEIYAEALSEQDRFDDALLLINSALKQSPQDASLLLRKRDIEYKKLHADPKPPRLEEAANTYQRCCRGEFVQNTSRLHCYYNSTTTPFLKLAPIKMEEVRLDPYMVLFHDVISDAEIAELQQMAKPKLKRATVYSEEKKKSVVVDRRTSKFAWFADDTNDLTRRLNQRITDMTGFDMAGSEMLQAMNYGLGGHYDTHFDFFNLSMNADIVSHNGDRMATVLFYMSDVEQGGATVFTNIRTAVFPKKGAAIMWYNLNNRMEGDWKTLHAACPVIVGSKWVCNKWIRERNQLLRRPCYGS